MTSVTPEMLLAAREQAVKYCVRVEEFQLKAMIEAALLASPVAIEGDVIERRALAERVLGLVDQHREKPFRSIEWLGDQLAALQAQPVSTVIDEDALERACEAFWGCMKRFGCSQGFHEGASETFAQQPENDEKQAMRDCIAAALAALPAHE